MTLAILPGAGLHPNLKWSVPDDRPTKLPVLLNKRSSQRAQGPSSPPLRPSAPQALADPLL